MSYRLRQERKQRRRNRFLGWLRTVGIGAAILLIIAAVCYFGWKLLNLFVASVLANGLTGIISAVLGIGALYYCVLPIAIVVIVVAIAVWLDR